MQSRSEDLTVIGEICRGNQRMGTINSAGCQDSEIRKQKSGPPKFTLDIDG